MGRGRKIRGTTSGSSAPHNADLTVSDNTHRYIGQTRPFLLDIQKGRSGRYFTGLSCCLAPTGSSLEERITVTSSHLSVVIILTKERIFVNQNIHFASYRDKLAFQHFLCAF